MKSAQAFVFFTVSKQGHDAYKSKTYIRTECI